MLDILTTDEFAAWFAALDDEAAEEVATALEIVEQSGVERAAPGSSEWLLWYEHPGAPEVVLIDDWPSFHDAAKHLVARLESARFAARLNRLSGDEARGVLTALDLLRTATDVRRRGLSMVAARAWSGGPEGDPYAVLRRAYHTVAAATGLTVHDLPVDSSALREITLRSPAARLRLLYGVDARRELGLVILGERLDRAFYGDSVRLAERVWRRFLEKQTEAGGPAPSR
jgi:hypothetical protein